MITIRELCAVLGVGPTTIRLYEKYLPKDPWVRGENNYRGFYFENMLCLLSARMLGAYGITMKDSVEAIVSGDPHVVEQELARRAVPLSVERRRFADLIESLESDRALFGRIPKLLDSYELIDIPSFFYLESAWTRASKEQKRLVDNWSREAPFVRFVPHYHIEGSGRNPEPAPELPRSGFSVPVRFADYVDLASSHVSFIPSFRAVASVVKVDGIYMEPPGDAPGKLPFNEPLCAQMIERMRSCLSREGAELSGNIYTRLLYASFPSQKNGSDAVQYYYVFTPFDSSK